MSTAIDVDDYMAPPTYVHKTHVVTNKNVHQVHPSSDVEVGGERCVNPHQAYKEANKIHQDSHDNEKDCCIWTRSHKKCILVAILLIVIAAVGAAVATVLLNKKDGTMGQGFQASNKSSNSLAPSPGTHHVTYQVDWGVTTQNGCRISSATLTATCENFIEIPPESKESCTKESDGTVQCKPDKSINDRVNIRCVGSSNDDVGLEVSIEKGSYV